MQFSNTTEIYQFLDEIEKIAQEFQDRGRSLFFGYGCTTKAKLIFAALERVKNDVVNNTNSDGQGFKGYYSHHKLLMTSFKNQQSLFDALNHNRLPRFKAETNTILRLERQFRKEKINSGFRKLIELLRSKFDLVGPRLTRSNDDVQILRDERINYPAETNKTELLIMDQGITHNPSIKQAFIGAKISGLNVFFHSYPNVPKEDKLHLPQCLVFQVDNDKYMEIVEAVSEMQPLPNDIKERVYNK